MSVTMETNLFDDRAYDMTSASPGRSPTSRMKTLPAALSASLPLGRGRMQRRMTYDFRTALAVGEDVLEQRSDAHHGTESIESISIREVKTALIRRCKTDISLSEKKLGEIVRRRLGMWVSASTCRLFFR